MLRAKSVLQAITKVLKANNNRTTGNNKVLKANKNRTTSNNKSTKG